MQKVKLNNCKMNYLNQYPMTAQERAKIVELHGENPDKWDIPAYIRRAVQQTTNYEMYYEDTNEKS